MKVKKVESKSDIKGTEKLKKVLLNIWRKIKNFFKKIGSHIKKLAIKVKDKFMELPKKVRLIIYVWVLVVVLIFLFMTISNSSKKFYAQYEEMENQLSTYALKYVKEKNIYSTKDNKLKIDLETLKEENYVNSSIITDDTCEGISVVYYDDKNEEYVVDSYLNCKGYTSKNYWDYK